MKERANTRLSITDWKAIEEKYASGTVTLEQLSEEYKTPKRTIQAHLNKNSIRKGTGAEAPLEAKNSEAASSYRNKAKDITIKLTDALNDAIDCIPPGNGRAAQIQRLTTAACKLFDSAEKVGLLTEDDDLPVLQVIEITAAQIEQMRQAQRDEDTELGLGAETCKDEEHRDYEAEGIVSEGFDDDEAML